MYVYKFIKFFLFFFFLSGTNYEVVVLNVQAKDYAMNLCPRVRFPDSTPYVGCAFAPSAFLGTPVFPSH